MVIALAEFAVRSRPCENDEGERHHHNPAKETRQTSRIRRKRPAPVRDRPGFETKGKRRREFVRRDDRGTKKAVEWIVLRFHDFSPNDKRSNCRFIFWRARKARTLTSDSLQPVRWRTSATESCCK